MWMLPFEPANFQGSSMKAKLYLAALPFLTTALAQAADVSSVTARGHTITVGDTADSVFAVLKEKDMVGQDIQKVPTGLKLTKRYKVQGKSFVLVFSRPAAEGPYRVASIDADLPPAPSNATKNLLASAKAFEATSFYKKNFPTKDSWSLKTGGMNNSYSFDDSENLGAHISVSITETKSGPSDVSVIWYGKSTKTPARITKTKEAFLSDLLSVTAPSVNPKQVVAYIKKVGSKSYPGGSTAMPRTTIAGLNMHAGTAGESLIVGIER